MLIHVNQYVKYLTDRRPGRLGFEPHYPVKWMAAANDTLELVNFESTNTSHEVNAGGRK